MEKGHDCMTLEVLAEARKALRRVQDDAREARERLQRGLRMRGRRMVRLLGDESAQGTTEYAILVGVLVVIAILAIIAFRDKVSELWDAIASGINSL